MSETNRPSLIGAIEHKCHDCMAGYSDGHRDCARTECPLYYFMPYRQLTPAFEWQTYSARQTGYDVRPKREMTDEQRSAVRERFRIAREKRVSFVESASEEQEINEG